MKVERRAARRLSSAKPPDPDIRRLLTEGVFVAASTVIGYAVAIEFERGYCQYFGIPDFMVSPTLPVIAVSIVVVLTIAFLFLMVPVAMVALQHRRKIFGLVDPAYLLAVATALWITFSIDPSSRFAVLLAFAPFPVAAWLATPKAGRTTVSFIRKALSLFAVGMGVILLASALGRYRASITDVFYVLRDEGDVAVVRNYGDVMLAVSFDRSKRQLKSEVLVVRASESAKLKLSREVIGPFPGYAARLHFPSFRP